MSDDDSVSVAVAAVAIIIGLSTQKQKRRRKHRYWVRPSLLSRAKYSSSDMMKDLILDDTTSAEYRSNIGFKNFFQMSTSDFENLLNKIGSKIYKEDTQLRKAIPASDRLAVTLRFLATRDSYQSLSYTFKISKTVISKSVPNVCNALLDALQEYIQVRKKKTCCT